ncbi:MAG: ADP-ribosylglycohydrolase family protein [Candidatus Methylomirabilia bacterium]
MARLRFEELKRFLERSAVAAHAPDRVTMRERYRGVLVGVAAGNALGLGVEGWSRRLIEARFPNGVREADAAERERPWDDDLAQTAILGEALLAGEELTPEDLASRLLRWAYDNGRGMGNLSWRVLSELASGTPPAVASRRVWERDGRAPAGNGAVMRCAPVALRWRTSGHRLVEETATSALVTHYDPRCVWSAVALNVALALSLGGATPDLEELATALDRAGAPVEVGAAIRFVRGRALPELLLDHRADMGYTLKAMQVGLWSLQQELDFEEVLVRVVNAGGDTDTNGAVAGAVMGSRVGVSGIPSRWVANIREAGHLLDLADRLFEACEGAGATG